MLSKNRVKYIQSLKQKKYRQKYGQFLVEGEKSVLELLHSKFNVNEIIADADWLSKHADNLLDLSCTEADEIQLNKISSFSNASPVCAIVDFVSIDSFPAQDEWCIALDGIKDPGNLGTIIRTADWYGVKWVVCSNECVDMYNPKVISSTMGSFGRVNVIYTDLVEFIENRKLVYATLLEGKNIRSIKNNDAACIIIGSESHGISDELLKLDHLQAVTIPGQGETESLNAAIATAIVCERLIPSIEQ